MRYWNQSGVRVSVCLDNHLNEINFIAYYFVCWVKYYTVLFMFEDPVHLSKFTVNRIKRQILAYILPGL